MELLPYTTNGQSNAWMKRAVFHGFLGSTALLFLYFLVMRAGSGSWDYTTSELIRLRYFVVPLLLGFGIQIGLFSYLRSCVKVTKLTSGTLASSAGTSSAAMLACCAHHITDLVPLIGLSALSLVLAKYQAWFLGLGIASNLVGIFLTGRQVWRRNK